ncbi:MAG: phosphoribosylglycinamide synthetase C domain-containing protein, partial [Gaiellaceae bacterium]
DGIKVLEFNVRFGDPETQAILPRLEGDLLTALAQAAEGTLGDVELSASDRAAVTVVLAGGDYPARSDAGSPISGIAAAEATGALVFQAGTATKDGRLVTAGGRILDVTGLGDTLEQAREAAYEAVGKIGWQGMRYRGDIARLVAEREGAARG